MASPSRSPSNEPLSGCEKSTAFKWSHLVYVPNIIGYVRIGFLLKAIHQFKKKNKKKAIMYYIISYLLDAADGKAARMCNQKTDFGYWLDMLTDRFATCGLMILQYLDSKNPLYLVALSIEIISHTICMMRKRHQKDSYNLQIKNCSIQNKIISGYIDNKLLMLLTIISTEVFALKKLYSCDYKTSSHEHRTHLINYDNSIKLLIPLIIFRHLANVLRSIAVVQEYHTDRQCQSPTDYPDQKRGFTRPEFR